MEDPKPTKNDDVGCGVDFPQQPSSTQQLPRTCSASSSSSSIMTKRTSSSSCTSAAAFYDVDIVDGKVVDPADADRRKKQQQSPVTFAEFPDVFIGEDGGVVDLPNVEKRQSSVTYIADFPDVLLSSSSELEEGADTTIKANEEEEEDLMNNMTSSSSSEKKSSVTPLLPPAPRSFFETTADFSEGYDQRRPITQSSKVSENSDTRNVVSSEEFDASKESPMKSQPSSTTLLQDQTVSSGAAASQPSKPSTVSSSLRQYVQMGKSERTDFPLLPSKMALLVVDIQTYCCDTTGDHVTPYYKSKALPQMISNTSKLVNAVRSNRRPRTGQRGNEVIFTMIQSQTNDGRDLSLDYKLSGPYFENVPKVNATYEEMFLSDIIPQPNNGDIVIPKTSCSVFISTNLDYVLRQLDVEQVVVVGQLTEQCVESAVRDGADLGYFMTVVDDACATYSEERHQQGLKGMSGFCRICTTAQILQELSMPTNAAPKTLMKATIQEVSEGLEDTTTTATTTPRTSSEKRQEFFSLSPVVPHHLEDGAALAILRTLSFAKVKFMKYMSINAMDNTIQSILIPLDALKQQGSLNYPWKLNVESDDDDSEVDLEFQPDPGSMQFASPTTAVMFGMIFEKKKKKTETSKPTIALLPEFQVIVVQGIC